MPSEARPLRRYWPDAWEVDGEGGARLLATRCRACGGLTFPPAAACPRCWEGERLEPERLPAVGTLYASSTVHVAQDGIPAPYAVGCADFAQHIRVAGRLSYPDPPQPGDRVAVAAGVIRQTPEADVLGWLFVRAAGHA